ncbi:MAG: proton-translocating transhydrogenase family protein [Proteobacteria bacterium]|nr:proton-translocating transhydrogenase family protein [Pseudomonadota bacterium]
MCQEANHVTNQAAQTIENAAQACAHSAGIDPFIFGLTAFILACFVGYFVVWKVTPALHTPLMSVTNAVSSVIVVGAIIALGSYGSHPQIGFVSFLAVLLASVNIFGGFVVTWRMLEMFRKK